MPNAPVARRPSDRFAVASLASARGGVLNVFFSLSSLRADAGAGAAEASPCGGHERCERVLRCGKGGEESPDEPYFWLSNQVVFAALVLKTDLFGSCSCKCTFFGFVGCRFDCRLAMLLV